MVNFELGKGVEKYGFFFVLSRALDEKKASLSISLPNLNFIISLILLTLLILEVLRARVI